MTVIIIGAVPAAVGALLLGAVVARGVPRLGTGLACGALLGLATTTGVVLLHAASTSHWPFDRGPGAGPAADRYPIEAALVLSVLGLAPGLAAARADRVRPGPRQAACITS